MRGVWDAISGEGDELEHADPDEYSPGDQLRLAISAIWGAVDDAGADAYVQRAEAQKALTAYQERRDARARELTRAWREMRGLDPVPREHNRLRTEDGSSLF